MATYFKTLEQAQQHLHHKKSIELSKIDWCIIDCTIGFLVLSEAQAQHSFPDLFQGYHAYLTKIT